MASFTQTIHASANGISLIEAEDYAAMKTLLSLGTMADQAANSVAITGGTITGITGPVSIDPDNSLRSADAMMWVGRDVDDTTAGNGHCFSDSSVVDRSGTIGYNSFDARTVIGGTNIYDHVACFQSGINYGSTGAMSSLWTLYDGNTIAAGAGQISSITGFHSAPIVNSANQTLTNRYGMHVADVTGTGTVKNNYGIYIAALSNGTNYNLGIANNSQTYLGANVGINQIPTDVAALEVTALSGDYVAILRQSGNDAGIILNGINSDSVEIRQDSSSRTNIISSGVLRFTDSAEMNKTLSDVVNSTHEAAYDHTGYAVAATYVGSATIVTVGTIGTGVWQGTAIGDTYIASATTWNAKIANVSEDTTPQLGGDLDANGNTIHFGTAENTQTPTGTTATIDLGAENHHTLNCGSASGTVTLTLTVPPGPTAGTIIVTQGATARDITWSPSSGSAIWLGSEPTWASDTNLTRIVSWRWNATNLYLSATDTNS